MAEYPSNFTYSAGVLSWTNAPDTFENTIEYAPSKTTDWEVCYKSGANTSCPFNQVSGDYSVRGKRRKKNSPDGNYSPVETISVP
jgi:hypothetical protein